MNKQRRSKILTIVGARPQFIKLIPVSKYLRKHCQEILVHTGQHYDFKMSEIFFKDLKLPNPDYNLNVGSGTHANQIANMMVKLESLFSKEKPNLVLLYGDTNSTLAAALVAVKQQIPIAHVEAGPRSYDMSIPEEVNRILTDRVSDLLFCPTIRSVDNLKKEGFKNKIYLTGDVMLDMLLLVKETARARVKILDKLGLSSSDYYYVTIHRPHNVDTKGPLSEIVDALTKIKNKLVFPVHPRTKKKLKSFGLWNKLYKSTNIIMLDPVGYLESVQLESNALKIITDSGGIQREAYFLKKPCLTLMDHSPWPETVAVGWNKLVRANAKELVQAVATFKPKKTYKSLFGNGYAGRKISRLIVKYLQEKSS